MTRTKGFVLIIVNLIILLLQCLTTEESIEGGSLPRYKIANTGTI